jgi:hypothetical protein
MNTADFLKEARELCALLERHLITKAKSCAVTLSTGDGTLIHFDRSDRPSSAFHDSVRRAFPDDRVIMSYDVKNPMYARIERADDSIFSDSAALRDASRRLIENLRILCGEEEHPAKESEDLHLILTESGAFVSARDMKSLQRSAFILEQYARKIAILDATRKRATSFDEDALKEITDRLNKMEEGKLYVKERK